MTGCSNEKQESTPNADGEEKKTIIMADHAPELVEFLSNYTTSSEITSEALAYMQDNDVETKEAAMWFLEEYEELWTSWVPAEIAEKVKAAL